MPTFITVAVEDLEPVLELVDRIATRELGHVHADRLRARLDEAPRHAQVEELPLKLAEVDAGNLAALGVAHHRPDHATSVAAAEFITVTAGTLRARALAALVAAGTDGLTDVELEARLEVRRPTGGNRRGELVKLGLVEVAVDDSTDPAGVRTRIVPGHLPATVWQATPRAIGVLEELGYRVDVITSAAGDRHYLVADPPTDADRPPRVRLEVNTTRAGHDDRHG